MQTRLGCAERKCTPRAQRRSNLLKKVHLNFIQVYMVERDATYQSSTTQRWCIADSIHTGMRKKAIMHPLLFDFKEFVTTSQLFSSLLHGDRQTYQVLQVGVWNVGRLVLEVFPNYVTEIHGCWGARHVADNEVSIKGADVQFHGGTKLLDKIKFIRILSN